MWCILGGPEGNPHPALGRATSGRPYGGPGPTRRDGFPIGGGNDG